MERRTFLVGSAMALPMMGANDKVNVAVIGVGGRGSAHVKEYLTIPNAHIGALCDVNTAATERNEQVVLKSQSDKPKIYQDLRKLYEDKDIDAVSIATPNHWHALATIWACQAGKDVYVEKPASYNIFEGQQMVKAARKYNRMVQVGMQSRSIAYKRRAIELLHDGAIGKVYYAKGLCFKRRHIHRPQARRARRRRAQLGHLPRPRAHARLQQAALPLQLALVLGHRQRRHRQPGHPRDGRRALGSRPRAAKRVVSTGGKFVYEDDQETPNTQIATFDYGDAELVFEVRGLNTGGEASIAAGGPNFVGNIWLGSKGYMSLDHQGFQIYLGDKREPGEGSKGADKSRHQEPHDELPRCGEEPEHQDLHGEVQEGATSAVLVHMANTSYRLGRKLAFDATYGEVREGLRRPTPCSPGRSIASRTIRPGFEPRMVCARCSTENPDGARFCIGCGSPVLRSPDKQSDAGRHGAGGSGL